VAEPRDIKSTMSGRRRIAQASMNAFSRLRDGRYSVHRGGVNWAEYPFGERPYAVAVTVDNASLLRDRGPGLRMTLGFEIFASLPDSPDDLDDSLLDDLYDDVLAVLSFLQQAKDDRGNSIVTRLDRSVGEAAEAMDADRGVQGLVVTIPVEY